MNFVAAQTANFSNTATVFAGGTDGGSQVGYGTGANLTFVYMGSAVVTKAAANSAFHSVIDTNNGASSEIYVDGSGSTVNPGTSAANNSWSIFGYSGGNNLDGDAVEWVAWTGTLSGANKTALNSNQHTYWGF